MQTTVRHYRIERRDIAFLRFIVEGYDGIAVQTVIDAARGIICLRIAPGCLGLVQSLLESLGRQMRIEPLEMPEDGSRKEEDD